MEDTKNSFLMKERNMLSRIEELQKNISEYRADLFGGTAQEVRTEFHIKTCSTDFLF